MAAMDDASWRPVASLATLRGRAELVGRTRAFFAARQVLEVDVPVLQGGANLDHGVVPYRIDTERGGRYLPTSPEHPLKRLVCAGAGLPPGRTRPPAPAGIPHARVVPAGVG